MIMIEIHRSCSFRADAPSPKAMSRAAAVSAAEALAIRKGLIPAFPRPDTALTEVQTDPGGSPAGLVLQVGPLGQEVLQTQRAVVTAGL
jgi:hypothetical protein